MMDPLLSSTDWMEARDAVERITERLRAGNVSKEEADPIGEALLGLSRHTKWEVRGAVARALEHHRHDTFLPAIVKLLRDENVSVRQDAERTSVRRAERSRGDFLEDEHAEMLADSFRALEASHGRPARDAALKVAERYVSLHIREAYHEIIGAIVPLKQNLELLRVKLHREKIDVVAARRNLRTAEKRTELTIAMLSRLREFNTQPDVAYTSESLRAIVKEAVALVRERIHDKRRRVRVEIDVDPELRVDAARARLVMAFANLVKNAYEAFDGVHRPRKLRIEARVDRRDWVVVTFDDNGCGISPENLKVVFKLFRKTKTYGTGVGLSFAKKIIESEHGGDIRLTSVEGKSTTVRITLPRERTRR